MWTLEILINSSWGVDFPCGLAGEESTCNVGDLGSIPGLRRSPGERKDYPLQYSGLQNSMHCIVHGIAKSRTQVTFTHCPTSQSVPCHCPFWPWLMPLGCNLTKSPKAALVLANPPRQLALEGPTAGQDFWFCFFLARGVARGCAKTVASLDQVKVLLQAHSQR